MPDRVRPTAILLDPSDPGLVFIRSLGSRGVPVKAVISSGYRHLSRSRWLDDHIVLDDFYAEAGRLTDLVQQLAGGEDAVLITFSDNGVVFVTQHRDDLPGRIQTFEGPSSRHLELMDKATQYGLAAEAGLRVPWVLAISDLESIERVTRDATFPCLLKPTAAHEWRRLYGARRTFVVRDGSELRSIAVRGIEHGLTMLATEYVPGPDEHLEGAVVLRRADGSYGLAYGRRKIRQYPLGFGAGTMMESASVPQTLAMARALLDSVGFVGVANLEAKYDARTGERILIEMNVRVGQGFALGEACGAEAPWRVYAALAGIPLPAQAEPRSGIRVVIPIDEPRALIASLRQGASPLGLLRSYRGVRSLSGLSLRDPAVLVSFAMGKAKALLRRLSR